MPRRLSREASIAAAEAAGVAFKQMPHQFFSAQKVAAAQELGQLAVEASQRTIEYTQRRSTARSALLVEREMENLAARGESISLTELCARVEARESQNFDVARHFLELGRAVYVYVAGKPRARPTERPFDPPLVINGRQVVEMIGMPPDGFSNDESQRWWCSRTRRGSLPAASTWTGSRCPNSSWTSRSASARPPSRPTSRRAT
ncbi:hypothetical protein EMIHUDRAFT_437582 [Emiliania huxleyi CCMP1516]|uniref:Uncharacterized protein n=2 Tax=Emiliania huxleyi TaxID=2903 RepID=A0A0D3IK28_EMIH1|nr:hypothetical protein EMIHUDRAFT_437582 [Emiliania huxleyi CCMP1516]EOD11613.1 hypothetical protein EMIHUDRAFT_437582 [Emiliania huxleyi CCMP1516]|eukprot:XP_005764042.1 hypothetical protein EMIHUDRAFT_437582 [Emiliania huxleyi CCMP1516]